jgi:hypothetical protein
MKQGLCRAIITIALLAPAGLAAAQGAGTTTLGIAEIELKDVINGVSAKRHVLGKDVYNDKNEVVGRAEDLILSRDRAVSYVILSVGGFLGIGEHDVVIGRQNHPLGRDQRVDSSHAPLRVYAQIAGRGSAGTSFCSCGRSLN